MNAEQSKVFVGVDVSKAQLDVAIGKDGEYWQVSNDSMGIGKCAARLQAIRPVLVVIESIGGLVMPLMTELYGLSWHFLWFIRLGLGILRDRWGN